MESTAAAPRIGTKPETGTSSVDQGPLRHTGAGLRYAGAVDAAAYLERIRYAGPVEPTLQTLRALHLAHLLAVPFENLDIHLGRPIALDPAALFGKIVRDRRGGFCYELNGLFGELLRALGFRATLLSAGVAGEEGGFGPEFDHLALRVDLDGPYLADVGFGEGFRYPLRLKEGPGYWVLARQGKPQYRFTLTPHGMADFAERCHYHQTSPASSFTRGRVCTLATPKGRITLSELRLIETRGGERSERALSGEEEFRAILRAGFGIEL